MAVALGLALGLALGVGCDTGTNDSGIPAPEFGLGGKADGDGKDGVTFPEIRQYLSQYVTSTADLLGESQSPFAGTGDEGAKVIP